MILDGVIKFKHPKLELLSSMLCSVCLGVLLKGSLNLLLSFMAFSLSCVQHAVPAGCWTCFQGQTTLLALDKAITLH